MLCRCVCVCNNFNEFLHEMYKNCDTSTHTHCQMLNWFGDKQRYFYCLLTHTRRHFKAGSRGLIDTLSFDATTSRNDWFSHTKLRASAPERGSPRETNARFALSAQLCELSLSLGPLSLSLSLAFIVIKFCCCCSCQTDQLWECLHSKPVCDTGRCANVWVLGGVRVCVCMCVLV